ncbi:right-handed parallel beta-helix repeat-containing protein, partial [Parapedobacter sp.]
MHRISLIFISWILWAVSVQAQTYVSPDGTGGGTSWADASSLADALADASDGDELWLRNGVYDITTTLSVTQSLAINGGYTGVGPSRDIDNSASVLDGGGITQIMEIDAEGVEIDGLVFLEGFAATGVHVNDGSGGGAIYVSSNNVTITNSIFRNNVSAHRIGSGAIYLWSCDDIQITDCLFENNRVVENRSTVGNMGGGAIHIRFGKNTRLTNTTFKNNYSRYAGGAIHDWAENTQFENCVFENNESDGNGGGLFIRSDSTTFNSCLFEGNQAVDGGGAYLSNDNSRFTNSIFRNNEASNNGGGIATNFGGIEITTSRFEGNRSLGNGGAIYNHRFATPSVIERVQFSENTADQGGAIYNYSEDGLKIVNALFVANQAADKGGAIFNNQFIEVANTTFVRNTNTAFIIPSLQQSEYSRYETSIFNSIFYLNTAKSGGYRADIHSENLNMDLSTQDVRRNILQEYTGTNNQVGVDPLFLNNTDDFKLQTASPAIDAGRAALFNEVSDINAGATTDLGDNPRNQGANIDIGAYEIDPSTIAIPTCTMVTAPTDGANDIAVDAAITWNTATDATAYRISIGTMTGGTDVVDGVEVTGTSYIHDGDWEEGTTYFVTVVPFNAAGEAEGCSEISFTIEELPEVPECTVITVPSDGATGVALDAEIAWEAAAGVTGYRAFIGTAPVGTDVVDGIEVTGLVYTPATDWEENTTYYVTVIPYNAAGEAEGCTEISFTTTTLLVAPECTT